jgi:small subunit ribosomal protein S17
MPKKIYTGKVISNKMDKTVVVAVTRLFQHPAYKKTVKRVTKLKAHDEKNRCNVGDIVKIIETRPLSKEKKWMVID